MRILTQLEKANRVDLHVRNARLRLVQRLLIAAAEADPELKFDAQWTRCLASATSLCVQYQKELAITPKASVSVTGGPDARA